MSPVIPPRRRHSRRSAIAGLGAVTLAGLGLATGCSPIASSFPQRPSKPTRIGILSPDAAGSSPLLDSLLERLRSRGYVDGQNVALEYRHAGGRAERLYDLATELVRLRVDLIIAVSSVAAEAARTATTTIPIVAVGMTVDPTANKLAAKLDRPGGNLTGTVAVLTDHGAEQLQLLGEVVPTLSRLVILMNPDHRAGRGRPAIDHVGEIAPSIRAASVQTRFLEVRSPQHLDVALRSIAPAPFDGMVVFGDPVTLSSRATIIEFAAQKRLPAVYDLREFAEDGGLLAYGESMRATYRAAADHIEKILQGANPADLPIIRPSWTQLVVNLKTAQVLGLTIPPSVLGRATDVIK
jgi:putative tryptophan/tyrosine transport system substrate-binding protein